MALAKIHPFVWLPHFGWSANTTLCALGHGRVRGNALPHCNHQIFQSIRLEMLRTGVYSNSKGSKHSCCLLTGSRWPQDCGRFGAIRKIKAFGVWSSVLPHQRESRELCVLRFSFWIILLPKANWKTGEKFNRPGTWFLATEKSGKTTFSVFYSTALVLYVCILVAFAGSVDESKKPIHARDSRLLGRSIWIWTFFWMLFYCTCRALILVTEASSFWPTTMNGIQSWCDSASVRELLGRAASTVLKRTRTHMTCKKKIVESHKAHLLSVSANLCASDIARPTHAMRCKSATA